jgi:hypothetical protein
MTNLGSTATKRVSLDILYKPVQSLDIKVEERGDGLYPSNCGHWFRIDESSPLEGCLVDARRFSVVYSGSRWVYLPQLNLPGSNYRREHHLKMIKWPIQLLLTDEN